MNRLSRIIAILLLLAGNAQADTLSVLYEIRLPRQPSPRRMTLIEADSALTGSARGTHEGRWITGVLDSHHMGGYVRVEEGKVILSRSAAIPYKGDRRIDAVEIYKECDGSFSAYFRLRGGWNPFKREVFALRFWAVDADTKSEIWKVCRNNRDASGRDVHDCLLAMNNPIRFFFQ